MSRGVYNREIRERHPVRYLFNQAKYRAKQRGIEFSVEFDEIEVPKYCPVFGMEPAFNPGRRKDNSFSLDRRDNQKGYTKENTRVISWRANQMKGDLSIDEVKQLLHYMTGA
jgi:hypothetical protein